MNAIPRFGTSGDSACQVGVRENVEPGHSHLGPPSIVHACEHDLDHDDRELEPCGSGVLVESGTCGASQWTSATAVAAPARLAITNGATFEGLFPANVLFAARA